MYIYIIPIALILIVALAAIGGAYNLINHIDDIIQSLGMGLIVLICFVLAIIIFFSIFYFVTKKHKCIAIILTFVTIGTLLYAAWQRTVVYEYKRYDAYYTINEIYTTDKQRNTEYIIPPGSLVQAADKNTDLKVYTNGIDSLPNTIRCIYKSSDKTQIIIEIDKSNIKKCGWIDCYGELHKE